jgi:hypothetical protein
MINKQNFIITADSRWRLDAILFGKMIMLTLTLLTLIQISCLFKIVLFTLVQNLKIPQFIMEDSRWRLYAELFGKNFVYG